mmetsp:Transcript_21213/g.56680  ORF Transcript_21213/g.56680 Transcript_21213/m.56680 type:complete len:167 (+) Transcript_21213:386-886(+)
MVAIHISRLVLPLLLHSDRACRAVQRSVAWPGFLWFVIDGGGGPAPSAVAATPMLYDAVQMLGYTLWGTPPAAYLRRLLEGGVLAALVNLRDGCCPSLLTVIEMDLDRFALLLDPKTNREVELVTRKLALPEFERAANIAHARILATDLNRSSYPHYAGEPSKSKE